MIWLLLNQHFVNSDSENFKMSVLEEVLSSELQLVLLLASGTVSYKTMMSLGPGKLDFNHLGLVEGCHL